MNDENNVNVNEDETVVESENNQNKSYTFEEVQQLIQSEADRRTNQALKTQQKKYEKQLSLSKLDGEAREKAEKDQRIAELEEQIKNFNVLTQKNEIMKTLSGRNLPTELCDFLTITDDAENNQQIIEKFDTIFKNAVKTEVEKRLGGKAPKQDTKTDLAEKDIKHMSLSELTKLQTENPELFTKLMGE